MSKAVEGAAMLAGAVGMGVAAFMDPALVASPFFDKLMESLVVGGIAMEAGAIADALTQNRGMGITTRQPASFRQIIYGEQRVPGVIVYMSTTGSHYDQYNMVIVLAGHECESIVNLYLDGRQVHWTGSGGGNSTRNGVNFGGNADSNTYIGPGGAQYNFGGLVYCEARYGDQQAGDVITGLTANDPNWAATEAGTPYVGGCTYVYLKIEYDATMFPQFPEIKFTVRGKNNIFDPRLAAPPATSVLAHPTTLLNGWGSNAHEGAYEEGTDQNYGWGLDSGNTLAYSNPDAACDGDLTTYASCIEQHSHQYAGCVWSFAAVTPQPSSLYLNINSEVRAINGALRSAGIWYSLDGGTTWDAIYNQPYRQQQWDSIPLSPSQDCSKIQVMAFLDSHDDMDHYVYEVQLATGPQGTSQSQYGYTTNWALIVADVLTDTAFGLGDVGSVNQDQLIAAANVCDEQVALAAGGSESRYTCHWHYDCGTAPGDVLQTMMPAAMGRLSRIGGEWFVFPAYWQGPSFTFTQSDLTGKVQWQPYKKFRDLFNRVDGTYVAPNYPYNVAGDLYDTNGWYDGTIQNNFPFAFQPTSYPEYACDQLHGYSEDLFLAQDGNVFLSKQLVQNCILSVAQAQRCAKIALMRNRQQGTGNLPMHLWAWKAQPLDVIQMTFAPYSWTSKQLEITGTRFMVDRTNSESPVLRFSVGVQETDQSVYEWSTGEELTVYDVPSNPTQSPYTITAPIDLTLASNATTALTNTDGSVTPRILASWSAPTDVRATQIQVQYQAGGASSWTDDGTVDVSTTSTYISGVVSGQSYNVRIRSLTASGASSTWTETDGCTVNAPNSTTNSYSNNPAIDLTQPTATTISVGAVAVTFGSNTVNYAARTLTITAPTTPTWYYVTIADPTQVGESGSPTLTATCQTSTALVGVQGNTYIGAIQAIPAGGGTQVLAGGWPAPQTFQIGD